jgi:hypothetical protein
MERGGGNGAAAPSRYASDGDVQLPSMSISTLWIALALIPVVMFACAGCCALASMRCWLSLRRSRGRRGGGRGLEADPEAATVPPSAALFASAMAPAGAGGARMAAAPLPPLLNGQFTSFEALARQVDGGPPSRRRLPGLSRALVEALPLERRGSADSGGGGDGGADCPICLQPIAAGDEMRRLPACGHALHRDCLGAWLARSACCPLCRTPALPAHLAPGKVAGGREDDDDDSEGDGDESDGGRGGGPRAGGGPV